MFGLLSLFERHSSLPFPVRIASNPFASSLDRVIEFRHVYSRPIPRIRVAFRAFFVPLCRDEAKVDEGREKFAAINAPSTTLLTTWSRLYLCGLALLECFCTLAYPFTSLADKFPFLPLMAISVYCAGGVCLTWALFYRETFAMYARSDSKTE